MDLQCAKMLKKYDLKLPCGSVGDGWVPLVEALIKKLIKLGWDKELSQIKEKFGTLRFYIGGGTEEMFAAIDEAEKASRIVCEDCGKPGKIRTGGWLRTLCYNCDRKQKKEFKERMEAYEAKSKKKS